MRVVHMTSVHPWDDNRIFNKMCRTLARKGIEVHLVAAMDDIYDGVLIDGVILHSVRKPAHRWERFLKTTRAVLAKARLIHSDLYHFHDPEFLPYISKFRTAVNKPVIYDVHEDYPAAILSKDWLPQLTRPFVSRVVGIFEKNVVMKIDGVIAAWPKIIDNFKHFPRIILINNYPYIDELQCPDIIEANDRQRGCFVYVGVLSPIRGILEMIKAVALANGKFKLILGGNWTSDDYKKKCQAEPGWAYCEYKGYLGRDSMRDLYATVQAGVIAFLPEPNHQYSVPNKIFEYMSAGLPVIASELPMQKSIVNEAKCGVLADARDPDAIYKQMCWIYENSFDAAAMGQRGKKAVEQIYNWDFESMKLVKYYEMISNKC